MEVDYHLSKDKSEYAEAWDRIREYYNYVRKHPKSERDGLTEDILAAYREVLWNWAKEKVRPVRVFVRLCIHLLRILEPILF